MPDRSMIAMPQGDPLGEILHLLKLTGTFYCRARLTAPWGIDVPAFDNVMTFVVVMSGRGWLGVGDEAPLWIEQGNLVLMTGAARQCLVSSPDAERTELDALPVRKVTEIFETLEFGGGGEETNIMYGIVRIDHAASGLLMELLPNVLKIDTWTGEAGTWLQGTLQFIAREASSLRPGGETVITRLADVVIIEAIRSWINTSPDADKGWLKGARDTQIGRAIMAIHRAPSESWTVEKLARVAGMSRSAFSARFTLLVGMPAMRYLTMWRMQLAHDKLLTTPFPIAAIAEDVGYLSEPAFCRAFKRVFRMSPGQVRRGRENNAPRETGR